MRSSTSKTGWDACDAVTASGRGGGLSPECRRPRRLEFSHPGRTRTRGIATMFDEPGWPARVAHPRGNDRESSQIRLETRAPTDQQSANPGSHTRTRARVSGAFSFQPCVFSPPTRPAEPAFRSDGPTLDGTTESARRRHLRGLTARCGRRPLRGPTCLRAIRDAADVLARPALEGEGASTRDRRPS